MSAPFAYRLLGVNSVPFIRAEKFWRAYLGGGQILACRFGGPSPGVPFITWGLMAYRLFGGVVPDLAKINIFEGAPLGAVGSTAPEPPAEFGARPTKQAAGLASVL